MLATSTAAAKTAAMDQRDITSRTNKRRESSTTLTVDEGAASCPMASPVARSAKSSDDLLCRLRDGAPLRCTSKRSGGRTWQLEEEQIAGRPALGPCASALGAV